MERYTCHDRRLLCSYWRIACALVGFVVAGSAFGQLAYQTSDECYQACESYVNSDPADWSNTSCTLHSDTKTVTYFIHNNSRNVDSSGTYCTYQTQSCSNTQTYSGYAASIAPGSTVCYQGCQYTFQPGAGSPATSTEIDLPTKTGSISQTYYTAVASGQACGSNDPPPQVPVNTICNVDTGFCVTWDGSNPASACDSGGNCQPVPETGSGGCSAGGSGALCGSPGGGVQPNGAGNPDIPPPSPPTPPIAPTTGSGWGTTVIVTTTGPGGSTSQGSNYNGYSCGGAGQPPCATGNSACPSGYTAVGNQCVSDGDTGGSSSCGAGQTFVAGTGCVAPPSCPGGGVYISGVCSGGTGGGSPSCPPGSTSVGGQCVSNPSCPPGGTWNGSMCVSSTPPSCPAGEIVSNDGTCVPGSCPAGMVSANGVCEQQPPQCGAGQVMVNGTCQTQCPAGQTLVNGTCTAQTSGNCVGGTFTGSGSTATCTCPSGQTLINGTCSTPPNVPCAGGTVISGQCVCPSGMSYSSGACIQSGGGGGTGGGGTGGGGTGGGGNGGGNKDCTAGPACADSAMGGGDCNTPPSCTGDTVTCGILNQSWQTRCELASKSPPADADVLAETADPSTVQTTQTIDETTFDVGGFGLPSNQCPGVPDVVVFGQTIHFGSPWCDALAVLGNLIVLIAYIVGYKILAR